MVDAILYGKTWKEDTNQRVSGLFHDYFDGRKNYIFIPYRNNEAPQVTAELKSISRCDNRGDGFRTHGYKYSPPTFGKLNLCDDRTQFIFPDYFSTAHPYNFREIGLTTHMKEIVINVKTSFDSITDGASFLKLSSARKTAVFTNLHYYTVLRLVRVHEQEGK